jgi:hypothetical protein
MIERLLLDGINAKAARTPVRGQNDGVAFARANEAHAPLPLPKLAKAWAHVALDATVFQQMPVFCGNRVIHTNSGGPISKHVAR